MQDVALDHSAFIEGLKFHLHKRIQSQQLLLWQAIYALGLIDSVANMGNYPIVNSHFSLHDEGCVKHNSLCEGVM